MLDLRGKSAEAQSKGYPDSADDSAVGSSTGGGTTSVGVSTGGGVLSSAKAGPAHMALNASTRKIINTNMVLRSLVIVSPFLLFHIFICDVSDYPVHKYGNFHCSNR